MDKYKKILVICYNPLSRSNSNGRTLQNLLYNYPQEKIMQLYFENSLPDSETIVNDFYRITDRDVLKNFFSKNKGRILQKKNDITTRENKILDHIQKNRLNNFYRLIRNLMWILNFTNNSKLEKWIHEGNPDYILLMSGNNPFIDKIALRIKKKFKLPIVLYNCEDYYLKVKPKNWFALLSRAISDNYFKKIMRSSLISIYNSEELKESFSLQFRHKSIIIHNPSELIFKRHQINDTCRKISYIGNISNSRHESLTLVADELSKYGLKLDVYGNIQNPEARELLLNNQNIIYHGVVSYNESISALENSDIVIHAESFDKKRERDLKHAFSTKVADTLMLGACFFVYAPATLAVTKYLIAEQAACVATSRIELTNKLKELVLNRETRELYSLQAYNCALKNHSILSASEKYRNMILENI